MLSHPHHISRVFFLFVFCVFVCLFFGCSTNLSLCLAFLTWKIFKNAQLFVVYITLSAHLFVFFLFVLLIFSLLLALRIILVSIFLIVWKPGVGLFIFHTSC